MRIGILGLIFGGALTTSLLGQTPSLTLSASPTTGTTSVFTLSVTDANGYNANSTIQLLWSWDGFYADACDVIYSPNYNLLFLLSDTGSTFLGGYTPGSAQTISNSQCTLNVQATPAPVVAGTTTTLKPSITFNSSFVGVLSSTAVVIDATGAATTASGTVLGLASYTANAANPAAPVVQSLALPSAGYGTSLSNLTLQTTDTNGAKYIRIAAVVFANQASAVACTVYYLPGANLTVAEASNGASTAGSGPCLVTTTPTITRSGSAFTMSGVAVTINGLSTTGVTLDGPGFILGAVADAAGVLAEGGGGLWWSGNAMVTSPASFSQSFVNTGGSGSISVAAASLTVWTATAQNSWVHVVSGGFSSGSGTVSYTVDANAGGNTRAGAIFVDDVNDIANNASRLGAGVAIQEGGTPSITTSSLPGGTAATVYPTAGNPSITLAAVGGTPPYTWSAQSLPTGLSLNASSGVLSGMPGAAGTSNLTIKVTDSAGALATWSTTIVIYPPFTLTGPSSVSVPLGQGTPITLTATAQGYAGTVTLSATGAPTGVALSPAQPSLSLTGTQSTTVTTSVMAGPGATLGNNLGNLSVGGGIATSLKIPVTVTAQPNPVVTLTAPGACCWGVVDLKGYALENTPALPADKITSVAVAITANDDSGDTFSDHAMYGDAVRNDICGATGTYPGGTDCPNVQFDYLWQTGTATFSNSRVPFLNGSYTVTATAFDSTAPALSSSASVTVSVDNQAPSPVIVSPVNGNGLYGVEQQFTILYVSTHQNLDFGSGQVTFAGVASQNCTVQWTLTGSINLQSSSSGPSPCTLDPTRSAISNNGTNELTLTLWMTFPALMVGPVTIQAEGSDAGGETSPLSTLTSYTVVTATGTLPIPQPFPVTASIALGGSVTIAQTMYMPPGSSGWSGLGGSCAGSSVSLVATGSASTQTNGAWITVSQQFSTYNPSNVSLNSPIQCAVSFGYQGDGSENVEGYANVTVVPTGINPVNVAISGGAVTLNQSGSANSQLVPISISATSYPNVVAPTGVSASFASNYRQLSVAVTDPSLPAGTYAVQLSELNDTTYALLTQYGTVFVVWSPVLGPSISVGAISPVSVAVSPNSPINPNGPINSTTFTVSVAPINGYAGTVKLASPNTSTIQLNFNLSSLSLSSGPLSSTATIYAQSGTSTAAYTVPFTVSDTASPAAFSPQQVNVMLSVQGGPSTSYTALMSASSIGVALGQSTTANLVLTPSMGYSGTITASISGLPSGLSATFAGTASAVFPSGATQSLPISLPINISAGLPIPQSGQSCDFVINVTDGKNNVPVTVSVQVNSPGPLGASVDVSGVTDPSGNYLLNAPITFTQHMPDNGVGIETINWTAWGWTLPSGLGTGARSVYYIPTAGGQYCASFSVEDQLLRTAPSPGTLAIGCATVLAALGVTVTGVSSTTVGQTVTVAAAVSGGTGSYTYSWTTAVATSNPTNATLTPGTPGPVQVSVQVTDKITGKTASGSLSIMVYQPLVITLSGASSTTVGQSIALQVAASGGSGAGYTYSWTGAAPNQPNSILATFSSSVAGQQTVSVLVTDGAGNSTTKTVQITVAAVSALTVNLAVPNTVTALNTPVTLTATGSNGSTGTYTYAWTGATSNGSGSNQATFSASQVGSYTVNVTVTNAGSNTSAGVVFTVLPLCGTVPSREYVRLGGRIIAIENTACAQ